MKRLIALAAVFALTATALTAGGPVVVEDVVVEEQAATSKGWVIPALLIAVIGTAILSSDDEAEINTW